MKPKTETMRFSVTMLQNSNMLQNLSIGMFNHGLKGVMWQTVETVDVGIKTFDIVCPKKIAQNVEMFVIGWFCGQQIGIVKYRNIE